MDVIVFFLYSFFFSGGFILMYFYDACVVAGVVSVGGIVVYWVLCV